MDENQQPEDTPVEAPNLEDIPSPGVIARHLTGVFMDEEASNFERTMAAVGLNAFWLGCELERVTQFLERTDIVEMPIDSPKPRMN